MRSNGIDKTSFLNNYVLLEYILIFAHLQYFCLKKVPCAMLNRAIVINKICFSFFHRFMHFR